MRDSEIEQYVLNSLAAGLASSREVCVVSHDGVVTLAGTVPNLMCKLAALRLALGSNGVSAVVDNLAIKPSQGLPGLGVIINAQQPASVLKPDLAH